MSSIPPYPSVYKCNCACTSTGLAFIPLDGAFFTRTYRLFPFCGTNHVGFSFHNSGLGNVWTLISGYTEDGVPIEGEVEWDCGEGDTRILHGTMTVNSAARGGVVIEIYDDDDVLFGKWVSKTAFQPRCYLRMKLVEFDRSCAANHFDPRPCLWVYTDNESCLCDNDHWAFRVSFSIANPWTYETLLAFNLEFYELSEFGGFPEDEIIAFTKCQFAGLEQEYGFINGVTFVCEAENAVGVACSWSACILLYAGTGAMLCEGLEEVDIHEPNAAWARVQLLGGGLTVTGGVNSGGSCFGPGAISFLAFQPLDDSTRFCLDGGGTIGIPGAEATITPVRIPTTLSGYVDPECYLGRFDVCAGGSLWEATRVLTRPGKVAWHWALVSSTCEGWCQGAGPVWCVPTIPDGEDAPILPEGEITLEEEEGYGLTPELDGEQFLGGCGCTAAYSPPVIPCTGTSWHTLVETFCFTDGADFYIYTWALDSSTCDGTCDCKTVLPYELPSYAVTRAEAMTLGVNMDDIGVSIEGNCECDEPTYTPAECLGECDCDDITANKVFTIAGMTNTSYNGTWNCFKGINDCEAVDCCWSAVHLEGLQGPFTLSWSAGSWTMVFGSATYTVVATACAGIIVLNRVGGAGADGYPDTITVTVDP